MTHISIVPRLSLFSVSVPSNHSVSHTGYPVPRKVISYVPLAPSLLPGSPPLSAYIPRSNCVSHYCLILSAPTHIFSQSDCVLQMHVSNVCLPFLPVPAPLLQAVRSLYLRPYCPYPQSAKQSHGMAFPACRIGFSHSNHQSGDHFWSAFHYTGKCLIK